MRTALTILFLAMGGAAAAQEGQAPSAPPSVVSEAPTPSAAPTEEAGPAGLPALPADDSPAAAPAAPAADPAATGGATAGVPAGQNDAAPAAAATPEGQPGALPATGATTPAVPPHAAVGGPADPAPPAAHPTAHTDLYSIVMQAHWVVLAVMAGLAIAAFVTLVILIQKLAEFVLAFGKMRRTAKVLARSQNLAAAESAVRGQKGPAAAMVRAANEELALAVTEPVLLPGVRERTHGALVRIDAGAAQRLRSGTGILASIGSLSPFVGLFGTVFGIMNSFLAIAETKTTNLAVVAPGIAEALLATAIGLAAAIPAVLIYNICSRLLAKYRQRLADVAAATERLQSRDLDRLNAAQEV